MTSHSHTDALGVAIAIVASHIQEDPRLTNDVIGGFLTDGYNGRDMVISLSHLAVILLSTIKQHVNGMHDVDIAEILRIIALSVAEADTDESES